MSKELQVIGLTKQMLREAIDKNTYWKNDLAPLPKSKAIWLVSNTRISDTDYCGVLGYEGDTMISFIFMFPDLLNKKKDTPKKVYWMISWWVHKSYKDTVLGTYIYNEAVNLTGKQVLIKSYAENVNSFYEKQPFNVIASRLRHTIFFSLDASMLIGKFKFLKSFSFLLKPIDRFTGAIFRWMNMSKLKSSVKSLSYEYIKELDEETWAFAQPICDYDLIHKTRAYVNWQIDNNQYLQTPLPGKHPHKSLQTGISTNIYIHNLKIIKEGKIIGFLSYIVNYNEFNVKYFLVDDEENYELCVAALMENFINKRTTFIFTDDTKLSDAITKRYKTIFTHKVTKKGLAHKDTEIDKDNFTMLNRDGHFY